MFDFFLSVMLSKIGIGFGVLALLGAAGALAWLRFPRWMVAACVAAAVVHLYSGVIWQRAMSVCAERVAAAVQKEQERQGKVIDDAIEGQRARAAAAEARVSERDQEIDDYEQKLAQSTAACLFDLDDVERLRSIAR